MQELLKICPDYFETIDAGHGEQVAAAFEQEAERLEAMT